MELVLNSKLNYAGIVDRTSKQNKPYQMVLLRDYENFEEFSFFRNDDLVIQDLAVGDPVYCIFELSKRGYNINTNLKQIKKLK